MSPRLVTSLTGVDLPVMPPVQPMLAKAVKGVPDPAKYDPDGAYGGRGLSFEPKWDPIGRALFAGRPCASV